MFIRVFVSCFFLLLLSFFLLLMNFFNSIISAESRHGYLLIHTNIFSVFFVIRCHVAPYIFFFLFYFILYKALEFFFFFVIAVSRHGFCTDWWRCSKCRCVQFHFSAEITFTLNNTTHL